MPAVAASKTGGTELGCSTFDCRVGFFWLMILNQQRLEWTVNPVYSYGWAVPVLAAYLFLVTLAGPAHRWFPFELGLVCRWRGNFIDLLSSGEGDSGGQSGLGEDKLA